MTNLRILHTGDIQIEARHHQQRADEYNYALNNIIEALQRNKFDILYIAGDVFEFPVPNEAERSIFIEFLNDAKKYVDTILLIDGNHDLIQKTHQNTFVQNEEIKSFPSPIANIVKAINLENDVIYFPHSGIFNIEKYPNHQFIVWSQMDKWRNNAENYRPSGSIDKTKQLIELYHDPISGCKGFDDEDVKGSDKYPSVSEFTADLILAGDIHKGNIYKTTNKTFAYCSSLVIRDYGEGDKYNNFKRFQSANDKHGYNEVNTETKDIKFIQVRPHTTYNTYYFKNFDYENFDKLELHNQGEILTRIRLVVENNHNLFAINEEAIRNHFKKICSNCLIDKTIYGTDVLLSDSVEADMLDFKENQIISDEQLIEISKDYITKKVQSSKSVPADDKEQVIEKLSKLFETEMISKRSTKQAVRVQLVEGDISNFMSLGDNIEFEFTPNEKLVRISGSNGVGKTTLIKFILWMLADQVFEFQNKKTIKDNRIALFNDSRFTTDEVIGSLIVKLNNDNLLIRKTLKRNWNKKATKDVKLWKGEIDSVDQTLIVTINDQDVLENDAAQEYLINNGIGTWNDLVRNIFIDQNILDNTISISPADLSNHILYELGMNFFVDMGLRVDEIRTEEMSKVYKPSKDIETLQASITETQNEISQNLNNEKTIKDQISDKRVHISSNNQDIKAIQSNIINVGYTKEEAELAIVSYNNNINQINEAIKTNGENVDKLNSAKIQIETISKQKLSETLSDIESKTKEKSQNIQNKNDTNIEIANYKVKITERIGEIKDQDKELLAQLNKDFSTKSEEQKTLSLKQSVAERELNDLKLQLKHAAEIKVNTKNQSLEKIKTSEELHKRNLTELESKLKELQNTKTCLHCGQELHDEALKKHNQEISVVQDKIETIKISILTIPDEKQHLEDTFLKEIEELKNENVAKLQEYENIISDFAKKISDISTELVNINNQITSQNDSITEIINTDEKIEQYKNIVQGLFASIETFDTNITNLESDINNLLSEKQKYENQVNSLSQIVSKIHELEIAKLNYQNSITDANNKIADIQSKFPIIEKNKELQDKITEIELKNSEIEKIIEELENDEKQIAIKNIALENNIKSYENDIEMHKKYRIADSSMRIYKQLLGKDGLQWSVFNRIIGTLNTKLNELLDGLNFRLFFDEWNNLQMLDMSKPNFPIRNVNLSSGMEKTFLGLSLVYILKILNPTKTFNVLFIDEITGKLNDGSKLSYEATNYQEKFVELINKIKEKTNIWIVDHVLKELHEDAIYEVIPSNDGNKIVKL